MKITIFGASSKESIGYFVGNSFSENGNAVVYASRSGSLGVKCDINDPESVSSFFKEEMPDIVINAAGVFSPPQKLGQITEWESMRAHILAKSFGNLVLADASQRFGVKRLIVLGGRALSSHPGFVQYTIGNGAAWALASFAARHNVLHTTYIDLPLIRNSNMGKLYLASEPEDQRAEIDRSAVDVKDVR
jgi:hypothetical protein